MYLKLHLIFYNSFAYIVECPYQFILLRILQSVLRAALDLTTAVTPAVLTVLMANVITLTGPVPVDVNRDTTLTRASYAIQVSKNIVIICGTNNTIKVIYR